jgi:uncharacterized protein (TIGR03083 family)
MNDTWDEVAAARTDLVDLLETLTLEEWDAQTLCDQWKVRDVVAHLIVGSGKLGFGKIVVDLTKSGFKMNKRLARTALEKGKEPPEQLLEQLKEHAALTYTPPMTKPMDMLADTVVHTQDIRRALGKPKDIPQDRLRAVLDEMKAIGFLGNKKRIAGLKLSASDMLWTHGDGPEVRGTGEALLMAMCGRGEAVDELSGDGVETLRSRMPAAASNA